MSRGQVRRTKKRTKEPEPQPDVISDNLNARIDRAQEEALGYLERELQLLLGTPGNFAEVVRVTKALEALRPPRPVQATQAEAQEAASQAEAARRARFEFPDT